MGLGSERLTNDNVDPDRRHRVIADIARNRKSKNLPRRHGDTEKLPKIARIAKIAEIENRNVKETAGAKISDGG